MQWFALHNIIFNTKYPTVLAELREHNALHPDEIDIYWGCCCKDYNQHLSAIFRNLTEPAVHYTGNTQVVLTTSYPSGPHYTMPHI